MRVAILGAGAMGSWFGGQLALQGHTVQLLTTNLAHLEAVRAHGLELQSAGAAGDSRVNVGIDISTPDDYDGLAELVIILTKSFQTHDAMQSIAPRLARDTAVLSLQNGLGNARHIQEFVLPAQIWLGVSMMPVDRLAPGVVASRGTGQTSLGHLDGCHHPLGERIVEAFAGSGMDIRHDPDVQQRIWEKVAFNAGMNACCALSHGTPGTIGQLPQAMSLVRDVAAEVAEVAQAEGVTIDLQSVFDTIAYACEHHGSHKASMLQDLLAGRRTEVDALNGAIVELGERWQIPTPLNAALATLVRLAELGEHRV